MNKLFTQEMIKMLSMAGIAGISLGAILSNYISKKLGSFAPYRKTTIIYLLVCIGIFALAGIVGIKAIFVYPTTVLIFCQLLFCVLGFFHIHYMHKYLKWSGKENSFWFEVLFTLVVSAFGFISFLLVFSLFNNVGYQYYIASATLFFVIAYFINATFLKAIAVPLKVYRTWHYPVDEEIADPNEAAMKNMLIISFEFQKKRSDAHFTNFRAKAPSDMEFGQLFYYFINDYNERHPAGKIEFVNENANPYGWVFYKKPKWYNIGTKYIDTDRSFFINHIKENDIIVCAKV